MTYLELVNTVLRRVREQEVVSVQQSAYSKLIGDYVNETKKEIEESWDWNVLRQTIEVTTTPGVSSYSLTGATPKTKILEAYNDTKENFLKVATKHYANEQLRVLANPPTGDAYYYSINGVDASGYLKVDIVPVPSGEQVLKFDCYVPQVDLSDDLDELKIDSNAVIQGTLMKAIIERGEDGGRGSDLQIEAYRKAVGNAIAIEANRDADSLTWDLV